MQQKLPQMSSSDVRQKLSGELAYLCGTDMSDELACAGLIPTFTKLHGTGMKGEMARGEFYTKYLILLISSTKMITTI